MLCYPDYSRCILNIVSSILKYYRLPYEYEPLPALDRLMSKFYKNIVFVVFDGMGTNMLEHNLARGEFLRKNYRADVTSVFPSTTASAMTSYYSGVSPNEHGWLGWSLFFKEFCRTIDVFTNTDTYTKQPVAMANAAAFVMPYETIFKSISQTTALKVQPFTISQSKVIIPEKGCIRKTAEKFERVCELIKLICDSEQNTFTYVQWCSPDDTAHRTGCFSKETSEQMRSLSGLLAETAKNVTDTLFIISADHGMIDIENEYFIDRMPDISSCLVLPPFVESRAASFFVKADRRTDFERAFASAMGHEFLLLTHKDVFAKKLLGLGASHPKTIDFVGDYFACALSTSGIRYRTLNTRPKAMNKANHGGLTEQEMTVPLIVAETPVSKQYKRVLI